MLQSLLDTFLSSIKDILIYGAILLVMVIGLVKCVFPVRKISRQLKNAVKKIENEATGNTISTGKPVWQDENFLGKRMQCAWHRFLCNAKQLDARGLTCNVADYINDDTTIYAVGHVQLSEVIPGLLTSLGILGTFIGLVSGLSGLDLSDSTQMVKDVSRMISGMTFAFTTSIVGVACSLFFNIFCRSVSGRAINALDDFQDTFSDIVMHRPVDDSVRMIIQQEDQTLLLRHTMNEFSTRVTDGVKAAVEQSMVPVTQAMNNFIVDQAQNQLQSLQLITDRFVQQMTASMGNELVQLGSVLSKTMQSQQVSLDMLNGSLNNASGLLNGMTQMQNMMERFSVRLSDLLQNSDEQRKENDEFLLHGSQVLNGMITAAGQQGDLIASLSDHQRALQNSMRDYADWSGRVSVALQNQTGTMAQNAEMMQNSMNEAANHLKSAYTDFVSSFSIGMSNSLTAFDTNMRGLINVLGSKLDTFEQVLQNHGMDKRQYDELTRDFVSAVSKMQSALADFTSGVTQMNANSGN